MGVVIAGVLVLAALLISAAIIFNGLIGASNIQGLSMAQLSETRAKQLATSISITGTSASDSGGVTDITVIVKNTGSTSISNFTNVDVVVDYPDASDSKVVTRLTYVVSSPGSNQWTVSGLSPDTFDPNIWSPDEVATLDLKVSPQVKSAASGTVVVATPYGVLDLAYFTNS